MQKPIALLLLALGACAVDEPAVSDRALVAGPHGPITPQPVACTVDVDAGLAALAALFAEFQARGETRDLRARTDALLVGADGWRYLAIPSERAAVVIAPAAPAPGAVQREIDRQAAMTAAERASYLAGIDATLVCEAFGGLGQAKPTAGGAPGRADTLTTAPMTLISVVAAQLAAIQQNPQPAPVTTPSWPLPDWPLAERSEWDHWSLEGFECGEGSGGALFRNFDNGLSVGAFLCDAPWAGPDEYAGGIVFRWRP